MGEDRKQRNRQAEVDLVRTTGLVLAVVPVVLALLVGILSRNIFVALLVLLAVAAGVGFWAWTTVSGYGAALVARPGARRSTSRPSPGSTTSSTASASRTAWRSRP